MNKPLFQTLCLFILTVTCVLFLTTKSQAQVQMHSFPGTSTFVTPAGRVGFFEQGTGRIFIYDDNLSECLYIGQMVSLGEPVQKLK